jgi:FMN phosphatase YigB (HAD superfamily)
MASKILGPKAGRAELYEFVNAGVRAEKAAKLMAPSGIEDVTMAEIYRHFNCPFKDADCTALIDMELQVESEVLRPVLSMLQFLNKERSLGKRIIYVTDNYLPADFIRGQLRKYGFWNDGDGLYVSGEIGLTKISGRLFDHVREKEGVRFSDISHYGDNQYADLNAAKRKGINAHLLDTGFNDFEFKICFDGFLGSGSTMVASHQLKRKCYGMELDPKYCDVIVKRMVKLDSTLIVKRNGIVTKDFE